MKYNIKLNIKSIIKAEQFLCKPFTSFDYSNENDLLPLLYCIVLSNNNTSFTYKEFLFLLEYKKISNEIFSQFNKEGEILAQFNKAKEEVNKSVTKRDLPETYIKDIVSALIIDGGIDANFLMNEVSLLELTDYIKAYENRKREQMESSRLWTFLTCAPHIDLKKIKSARDFYPFAWELEQIHKEEQEFIRKNEAELNKFLEHGLDYFKTQPTQNNK